MCMRKETKQLHKKKKRDLWAKWQERIKLLRMLFWELGVSDH